MKLEIFLKLLDSEDITDIILKIFVFFKAELKMFIHIFNSPFSI